MKLPILFGSIDQGTTSTRFILYEYQPFNHDLKKSAFHQIEHDNIFPKPGWVEQDPLELIRNTVTCIDVVLRSYSEEHKIPLETVVECVKGIGVTNQRETTVLWDRITGEPLFNAIVWNDLRTASLVEQLIKQNESKGGQNALQDKSGLPFSTYFSGMKLKWLLEKSGSEKIANAIANDTCLFGTIDTWLIWNLTGGQSHATDVTNASRTMLMNLNTCQWDPTLFDVLGIPRPGHGIHFPEIKSCAEDFGVINMPADRIERLLGKELTRPFAANGIHITGVVGDQQGATIGQKCFRVGEAKTTYGTGCFLLMNIGKEKPFKVSTHGLLTTVCFQFGKNRPVSYGLEGSVAVAGSGVKWLQKNMKFINSPPESEDVAATVPDNGGVTFVPAFSGLFAPYWDNSARGTIVGLTQFSTSAHIVRAMLESVCFQSKEVLSAMEKDANVTLKLLKVDGGMSRNNLTMQFQSDLLNVVVVRPEDIETTAKGAAMCAVVGSGVHDYEQAALLEESGEKPMDLVTPTPSLMNAFDGNTFVPKMGDKEREFKCKQWALAITKARGWIIE